MHMMKRKNNQKELNLFNIARNSYGVELFIKPKFTFTDGFLILLSLVMLVFILNFKNYDSSDYFYLIFFYLVILFSISIVLLVSIKYFELLTSKLFVYSTKNEIKILRFFKKKVISFDEIFEFQISIIKRYGVYNSSGGVRGPDVLIGVVEIKLRNLNIIKLIEFNPLVINDNESNLIEIIEKNCRDFIKAIGVPKSIQWNGIKYLNSN